MSTEQVSRNITANTQPGILYDAAEGLYRTDSSVRMVGSLARSAIMGRVVSDHRPNGERRNINAFHLSDGNSKRFGSGNLEFDGVQLSTRFDRWIRTEGGETNLVFPLDESIVVPLPEAETVFEAHPVRIEGKTLHTLKPEVLGRVTTMMRNKRPKDREPFAVYNDFLDSHQPTLHPELLKPFDDFHDEMSRKHAYLIKGWLRNNIYHQLIPGRLRAGLEISRWIPGGSMTPTEKEE